MLTAMQDAAWILVGAMIGTAICIAVVQRLVMLPSADAVSLASSTVFAMLACSLHDPQRLSPIRH